MRICIINKNIFAKWLYILLCIAFVYACNTIKKISSNSNTALSYLHLRDIVISSDSLPTDISVRGTIFNKRDSTIILLSKEARKIFLYSINLNHINKTIDLANLHPNKKIQDVVFIDTDTFIILLNHLSFRGRYHDSVLIKVSTDLHSRTYYHFRGSVIRNTNGATDKQKICDIRNQVNPLRFDGKRIYFDIYKSGGLKLNSDWKHPISGYFDVNNPDSLKLIYAQYPDNFYKYPYYTIHKNIFSTLNDQNKLVVGFGGSDVYHVFDPVSDKITSYAAGNTVIDSILPRKEANTRSNLHAPEIGWYSALEFDPYRKKYLRLAVLPPADTTNAELLNQSHYALMVLDTNFKLLGAGLLPDTINYLDKFYIPRPIVFPDGIYFVNSNERKKTGKFILSGYKITTSDKKLSLPLKAKLPNTNTKSSWIRYFNDVHHINLDTDSGIAVISVIPVKQSCSTCLPTIIRTLIKLNNDVTDSLPKIKLVFISPDDELIDSVRKQLKDTSLLYIDSLNAKSKYVISDFNPILLFIKQKRLLSTKIIDPIVIRFIDKIIKEHINPELKKEDTIEED